MKKKIDEKHFSTKIETQEIQILILKSKISRIVIPFQKYVSVFQIYITFILLHLFGMIYLRNAF